MFILKENITHLFAKIFRGAFAFFYFIPIVLSACSEYGNIESELIDEDDCWIFLSVSFLSDRNRNTSRNEMNQKTCIDLNSENFNERKINEVYDIFFFESLVKYNFIVDLKSNETGDLFVGNDLIREGFIGPDSDGIINIPLKPFMVKKRDYKIIFFINPPEDLKEKISVGSSLYDLLETPWLINGGLNSRIVNGTVCYDNFYMSNASGPLEVNSNQIYSEQREALAVVSKLRVFVQPAVGKITFSTSLTGDFILGDYLLKLDGMRWRVDVINRKMYWLRKMTYKRGGIRDNNLETSVDYSLLGMRNDLYAEDPNFGLFDETGVYSNEFSYYEDDNIKYNPVDCNNWKETNEISYVPENTILCRGELKINTVTHIILRIPYTSLSGAEGYMYYRIPIRHFMTDSRDKRVSLNGTTVSLDLLNEELVNNKGVMFSERFWGDYGVVRDNLYSLQLNSINKIGEIDHLSCLLR